MSVINNSFSHYFSEGFGIKFIIKLETDEITYIINKKKLVLALFKRNYNKDL